MALTGPTSRGTLDAATSTLACTFAAALIATGLIAAALIATAPIAPAAPDHLNDTASCPTGEFDTCHRNYQMRELAETGEQLVTDYLAQMGIARDSMPRLSYIPSGGSVKSQCVDSNGRDIQDDRSFNYCGTDNTVYVGRQTLWDYSQQYGPWGPISGIAHEYGHFLQAVRHVPGPGNARETIRNENQADCFSGTFVGFSAARGSIDDPGEVDRIVRYLTATASMEAPGRTHGTAQERSDSFTVGFRDGLAACSQYYPETPLTG